MSEKQKRHQIIFDVTQELHTKVKILSALRNITMNRWMQRAINERIQKEQQYDVKDKDDDFTKE